MDRINFKSRLMLFSKNNIKSNEEKDIFHSNTSSKAIQNSLWLQSMEPIKYAKNYAEKLYEIDSFKIETVEIDLFKKELFSNLKKQLDQKVS